jgi:hypothetical protein
VFLGRPNCEVTAAYTAGPLKELARSADTGEDVLPGPEDRHTAPAPPPAALTLYAGLLAGEVLFGLVFWLAWLVLFLALNVTGALVTAVLTAAFAVECERAMLRFVTGWTPDRARLALSTVPVLIAVLAAHASLGGWEPIHPYFLAIAAGLLPQALILRYLAAVPSTL